MKNSESIVKSNRLYLGVPAVYNDFEGEEYNNDVLFLVPRDLEYMTPLEMYNKMIPDNYFYFYDADGEHSGSCYVNLDGLFVAENDQVRSLIDHSHYGITNNLTYKVIPKLKT
ncbi:MAG: hypothetical protein AAGF07_01720 [Patescibacteria group bacterium]